MRWTTLGTMVALALAAYFLADRWGYSAVEAIFMPAAFLFVLMSVAVIALIGASDTPRDTAREFLSIVKRDFSDIAGVLRRRPRE